MNHLAQRIWGDENGFVVSMELILIATITIIGLITGLATVRNAIVSELSDVAGATQDLNQTYFFNGVISPSATTAGSDFYDALDFADDSEDISGQADNGIFFTGIPSNEL